MKTITIQDIKNNLSFNMDAALNRLRNTKGYNKGNNTLEDEKDLARAITMKAYNYYAKERKNFSLESDLIMEKAMNGYELSDEEIFELCTPIEELEKYRGEINKTEELKKQNNYYELDAIKKRVEKGVITLEDLNRLIEIMGCDKGTADALRQGFINSGKVVEKYEDDSMEL
ncbi:MAG: hypothetical protein IKR57_02350 [Bacilli bacterium]|nr:hypothetical protein [Bacilli bacterium]